MDNLCISAYNVFSVFMPILGKEGMYETKTECISGVYNDNTVWIEYDCSYCYVYVIRRLDG